ncbi:MAG: VWA domain-containing protein [Verrucomicrobia bacterium]|nr:VWA domain-containing protein [Verrucomicrobiota bacterium]
MSFLSPLLLATAAALAVPVWLHLRRRRKQAPVEFPSLRYLRAATARMKRQARVEDLGLLLLRVLLVALLAAAFARPVVRSGGGWLGAGRTVESVVVIDATASMGWRDGEGTRLDAAKRLAREWVEGLDRSDAVGLWVLTDRLERPVPVPIANRDHWFEQLAAIQVSEGSSTLAPVFSAASEWAESRSAGRKEIVVITDNQPAAWDWPADGFFRNSWHRGRANLVVLSPDDKQSNNTTVASAAWHDPEVKPGSILTGVATLANHGASPSTDLLECRIAGQVVFRTAVEIPAEGTLDVPVSVTVPATDAPVLAGELALAGDALATDDRWYFALPVRSIKRSLVVEKDGGPDGSMSPSFFLVRALAAGSAGQAETVRASEWPKRDVGGLDALWFTADSLTDKQAWTQALEFAANGGTVVLAGNLRPEIKMPSWPVGAGDEMPLPPGRIATRLLDGGHPLFDGVWNEHVPFPPLPQRTARRCEPAAGARALATLAGEFPLIVELPHGSGRVLWINASFDRSWGDLPLSPAYVALVQQFARAGDLARRASTQIQVGEAWPDLSNFAAQAAWPSNGSSPRATRGGAFDAATPTGEIRWRCAVNARRAESELRPLPSERLRTLLPGRLAAGTQGIREWRDEIRREVPLWPWLLGGAGLVFLAEIAASARAGSRRIEAANPERRAGA